jgi:hypothetical protein
MVLPSVIMQAWPMTFSSSRTLPGQECIPSRICAVQDRGTFVRDVFSEFRYVSEYPAGKRFPASIAPASKPLPTKFAAQKRYVFQPIGEVDSIEFATNILPAELRKAGIEVTGAPRNQRDFAIPSLGGPVWDIGFKQGPYIGRI